MASEPERPAAPADASPPKQFDEYELVSPLGRGAMGRVYIGFDRALDRHVAIKFISGLVDPIARARFVTEARAVARLQHPQVVTIYRIGEAEGWPYIVSELVRGETLDKLARPLPWRQLLDIGLDLARGLAAAHKSGVLHRDLKPSNAILGEDGTTKLLDFGLAKLIVEGIEFQETGEKKTIDVIEVVNRIARGEEAAAEPVDVSATIPAASAPPAVGITVDGAVVGTPLYLAPERWKGDPASRASDLYSLGAILYELVTGGPPNEGPTLAVLGYRAMTVDPTPVLELAPSTEPRLAAVIDRLVAREPRRRFHSADALAAALEEITRGRAAAGPDPNPYRGLLAFEAEHRGVFFGREAESRSILERLKVEGFILVAGDSGVGKSSLCRAGVLAAVEEGALGDGWSVISMVPGRKPMTALDHALARAQGSSSGVARDSADDLASDLRRQAGSGRGILLFVDQLEELVTLSDPKQAAQMADFIGQIAATPLGGLRLLATVRSDFLTRVSSLSGLRAILSRSLFLLPPLTAEGLRQAIAGPVALRGFTFEAGTVEALMEAITSPASLPLLQFTLAELWDARDAERKVIPRRALDELGGVAGALARHGDKVLATLLPAQRAIGRQLLTQLVSASGTRARRTAAELVGSSAERREVLEALVSGRLVAAEESEGEPSYELVHEALLSVWGTLRSWLDDEEAGLVRRERLRAASHEWDRLGRRAELLWSEPQLGEIAGLDEPALDQVSRDFLARSRRAARRRRLLRRGFAALVVVAVLAGYGLFELNAARKRDGEIERRVAKVEQLLGRARMADRQVDEVRRQALAAFDTGRTADGERLWRSSREQALAVDRKYIDAISLLDEALVFDPTHERVRTLLASALYDRILLAERDGLDRLRGELVVRLGGVDPSGRWEERLAQPGQLVLSIVPAGAAVRLERYRADRRRLVTSPVGGEIAARTSLPPGSYRLVARAPGRVELDVPFTLARGEELPLSLRLPLERDVPAGFAYVPPGRFLVGSAADDELRSLFFAAPPQHVVETGGYLIARHETTFAEWMAYLDDLAPEERARRTPRAGPWGIVKLTRLGAGDYEIAITSGKESYTARSGATLAYHARDRRSVQHWERFPVSGIAPADVEAYVGWLGRTGRVPKARLCSELEWERAARGADGRNYPHGDALEADDANYLATYGEQGAGPDEVGSHPLSRSPFGLDDMVGNVFEFTRRTTGQAIIVRGGAFIYDPVVNRIDNRVTAEPGFLGLYVGFRVCAPAPPT